MSQSAQTNKIPIPHSLSDNTTAIPTASQRALISHLRTTHSIPELSNILRDSLARTGWTDRVRALALELLRNGTCNTFPELMEEVMRRAKLAQDASSGGSTKDSSNTANGAQTNGTKGSVAQGSTLPAAVPGQGSIVVSKEWTSGPDGLPDVRLPHPALDEAAEYLSERISKAVEIEGK